MSLQPAPIDADWTCPFCSLLCDAFGLADGPVPQLRGSDCPRSLAGLANHPRLDAPPQAWIDGEPVTPEQAVAEATERLMRWRQPLFGGLGVDVAGARALYRLAARTGAIFDHADGRALMHGLRALQDRGQYTTTINEVRTRADLIVCVGTTAAGKYPEFFRRVAADAPDSPCERIVFLDSPPASGLPAAKVSEARGSGDLFADLQQLAAAVAQQRVSVHSPLAALAEQLRAARYAVLVWEAGALPEQGALLVELLNRIVNTLNRQTRAATLGLGGSDGGYATNYVFTWLSGLPLRSRAGPLGLEHEPLLYDTQRLVADAAVDGLLWISGFDPQRLPPSGPLPRIALGPPLMANRLREAGLLDEGVFIPVATPGIGAPGYLFRTDGGVAVLLVKVRDDGLPRIDVVLTRWAEDVEARR